MIVQEFDKLMLLSEGKQIYHGDFSLAIPYFEKLGYSCPSEMNASEFFLEIVGFSE